MLLRFQVEGFVVKSVKSLGDSQDIEVIFFPLGEKTPTKIIQNFILRYPKYQNEEKSEKFQKLILTLQENYSWNKNLYSHKKLNRVAWRMSNGLSVSQIQYK